MSPEDLSGYSIKIAARRDFDRQELLAMHQFRAAVFRERLAWEVGLLGGMEVDAYDALDPVYLMVRDEAGEVCACLRLLPTTGPYMLQNTFAELLENIEPPASDSVIELSRFAVGASVANGFRFSSLTRLVIRTAIDYGFGQGYQYYLTVTTPALERMLMRTRLHLQRLGRPVRMGVDDALALMIDIAASRLALSEEVSVDGT